MSWYEKDLDSCLCQFRMLRVSFLLQLACTVITLAEVLCVLLFQLEVKEDEFFLNNLRDLKASWKKNLLKLRKPPEKDR